MSISVIKKTSTGQIIKVAASGPQGPTGSGGGGGGAVDSVNGRTGAVTLASTDVGLANVNNTSDANKPVSTAQAAADTAIANAASTALSNHVAAADPHPNYALESSLAAVATSGAYADLSGNPSLGTAAPLNVAAAGDAASGEVVKGNDTRLSDARTPTNLTGPVTSVGNATAIANGAITNAMLANSAVANLSGTNSGDETGARIGTLLHAAANKTTLVDADETTGLDSANSFGLIRTTWTNVKAFLKTYFDTLYAAKLLTGYVSGAGTVAAGDTPLQAIQKLNGNDALKATAGLATASGLTMSTARLLGRSTASTGAIEEITLGTNLSMTSGVLNAAGGGSSPGGSSGYAQSNDGAGGFAGANTIRHVTVTGTGNFTDAAGPRLMIGAAGNAVGLYFSPSNYGALCVTNEACTSFGQLAVSALTASNYVTTANYLQVGTSVYLPNSGWDSPHGVRVASNAFIGFSGTTSATGTANVGLVRDAAGVLGVSVVGGGYGDMKSRNLIATGYIQTAAVTVGTLPTASGVPYAIYSVTDSLTPVSGATVAAGGSAKATVQSNGTNWIVLGTL